MGLAQTREAYIMTLGVRPNARRRGVAWRLLVVRLVPLPASARNAPTC